jgi:hypothetical protein
MKSLFQLVILLAVACAPAARAAGEAEAFAQWWPRFQAAVAKGDAKSIVREMTFPQPFENGLSVREIPSDVEFVTHFARYLTPEIRKKIATLKPERLPNGNYSITWQARGNEYSLYFVPTGKADVPYALDGLSEGPP